MLTFTVVNLPKPARRPAMFRWLEGPAERVTVITEPTDQGRVAVEWPESRRVVNGQQVERPLCWVEETRLTYLDSDDGLAAHAAAEHQQAAVLLRTHLYDDVDDEGDTRPRYVIFPGSQTTRDPRRATRFDRATAEALAFPTGRLEVVPVTDEALPPIGPGRRPPYVGVGMRGPR